MKKTTKNPPPFPLRFDDDFGWTPDFDKEKIELLVFGGENTQNGKKHVRGFPQFIHDVGVKHEFDLIHPNDKVQGVDSSQKT